MGRPSAATPRSISHEIKNWINRFSAEQAIPICPKCAGIHDPPATPERGTLSLDPSDSHPLRLKCSKCKKHLAAASQLKTAVVVAEVPFLPEQTECPCNPDEFLALSNTTANIKDELNETWQILQTIRDERDELRLEVEKLRSIPDPETATGAGAAEDTNTGNVHQEAEDQDIPNHEQEPRDLQTPTTDLNGKNIQDTDTESEAGGRGSTTNAAPEWPLQREGSNIYVAIEENGYLTVQEEASIVSNGDLLNAVNAFAAKYRTKTQGLLQEIEDLKLSNKKQAQALQEVGGKVDKCASARSNGLATDLSEENADRTKQHNKERRELSSAKPTRSTVGERRASIVDPDLPQRPHRQSPGTRNSQPRLQSASPRRLGSRLRHDESNHRMERSMSEEQDNRTNMPLGRTRDNGRPKQQDSRRRESRPEDLENRAPHTL